MFREALIGVMAFLAIGHAVAEDERRGSFGCDPNLDYGIADSTEPSYSGNSVRADLAQFLSIVSATHPDPDPSFDQVRLRDTSRRIAEDLPATMNIRDAWLAMARLNPHFHDAHTGLRHPVAAYEAHLAAGGADFRLPVLVDRQGKLRASSRVQPEAGIAANDRIVSINGRDAAAILAELMPRMRGETQSIQRLVLAFNFPGHLWTVLGPQRRYCIGLQSQDGSIRHVLLASAEGGAKPPAVIGTPEFAFSRPARDVAMLRIASFDPGLKGAFAEFLSDSFASLDEQGADTLLIDIRDNPGGAHDVSDQLVGYLTDREIPAASMLLARITAENGELAPNAAVGSVVRVQFDEPIELHIRRPPFDGNVYVLVSQNTYSQAIVFAAALQDARVARIVGEVTGGNANQTGQITIAPLANTGLQALAPVYVIYRPNGDTAMTGLQPDIPLAHDPLAPERMIEATLRAIKEDEAASEPREKGDGGIDRSRLGLP